MNVHRSTQKRLNISNLIKARRSLFNAIWASIFTIGPISLEAIGSEANIDDPHYSQPVTFLDNCATSYSISFPYGKKYPQGSVQRRSGTIRHEGSDIATYSGIGDLVVAPAPGVVVGVMQNRFSGNEVYLKHFLTYGREDGTVGQHEVLSRYAHNERVLVQTGQKISAGDVLAVPGDTGASGGHEHIHWQLYFTKKLPSVEAYVNGQLPADFRFPTLRASLNQMFRQVRNIHVDPIKFMYNGDGRMAVFDPSIHNWPNQENPSQYPTGDTASPLQFVVPARRLIEKQVKLPHNKIIQLLSRGELVFKKCVRRK